MTRLKLTIDIAFFAVAYSVALVSAQTAPTQIDANNATGVQAYNLYSGTRENINLATGNLNLTIPLVSLPGRAGNTLDVALEYDSKIWQFRPYIDGNGDLQEGWGIDGRSASVGQLGWRLNVPILSSHSQGHVGWAPNGAIVTCAEYIFESGDGSKHSFPNRSNCWYYDAVLKKNVEDTQHEIPTGNSEDGEFLTLSGLTVYTKDGTKILGGTVTDCNGNVTIPTTSVFTDTLGRTVNRLPGANTVTYVDSNGTTETIVFSFTNITLSPSFPNSGIPGPQATWSILTSITLPTGRSYSFQYNNFGELTKITYPTGGYTRYDYGDYSYLYVSWGYPIQGSWPNIDFREVIAKHVCRDSSGNCTPSTEDTTTYTPTITQNQSNNQYIDVVDPLGNKTRHQFSVMTGSYSRFYSPRETDRWVYSGQSTLLRTIHTDYTGGGTFTNWVLPIHETTTLNDVSPNLVTKTEWDYDSVNGYGYPIDNPIAKREYDYGSGAAPTTPIRQTITTWLKTNTVNGQDYTATGIHILNRKLTENVQDSGGNNAAQMQYEYDNYSSIASSGAVQHDSAFNSNYTTRGNVTKMQRWRNGDGAWLATTNTYDDSGNILSTTAPSNTPYDSFTRTTTFSYTDRWANQACLPSGGTAAAYVTTVTNAKSQAASYKYNSCTGTMASTTDPNSQTASLSFDSVGRLLTTNYPDGGQTSYCWSDTTGSPCAAAPPLFMTRSDLITSNTSLARKVVVDGVGHTVQTQLTTDPEGIVYTDIGYDGLGRRVSVSNPHRATSSSTDGTTRYTYDPLNRVTLVAQPDGSQVLTSYAGNQTTVTDEAGKQRKSQADGLGRLTAVWEDPSVLNYESDYQYDMLGNLIRVDQKGGDSNSANWRTRTFAYNSLSQMLCAAYPEIAIVTCPNPDNGSYTTGTIRYSYDNVGNVVTKTAPKPNQTASATVVIAYSNDALNRLTQRSYNDGNTPTAKYGYDGVNPSGCTTTPPTLTDSYPVGRRSSMCDGSGATSWSHEKMGRIAAESRTIAGSTNLTKLVTYAPYNLDGSLANLTYPSGRIITFAPAGAGRPLSAVETAHSINYVTNATYAPQGAMSGFQYGAAINGRLTYNSRFQPQQIYYTSGTVPTPDQLQQTCPTTAATIMSRLYDFGLGTNDNGNVHSITDCLVTNRTQNFDYDRLNRLADAYTTGTSTSNTNWGEVYTIDPWANLTNIAVKPGWHNSEQLNAAAASAQNRLNGFCYDAAGNMTGAASCPSSTYTYDAENRLTATAGYTYRYDGDGRRIIKCSGTYPACSSATLYWTGTGNDALAETDWTGAAVEEYAFFNRMRVARRDGTGNTVHYYFSDHLRSATVVTSATGTIQKSSVYYPYGGEIAVTGASFANNYKFTGKERDSESGLDYFGARHHSPTIARFISLDKLRVTGQRLFDPQGWNLYQYTRNTPSVLIDPDGNEWTWAGAQNVGNAQALVFGLAIAYMTNGRFQRNFDTIAQSKKTIMAIGDKTLKKTQEGPVTMGEGGEVGIRESSLVRDSNGKTVGVSNPVKAVENIDVAWNLGDFGAMPELVNTLKHETEHGVQLDANPLNYELEAETSRQHSPLEQQAQAAGADTSAPSQSMTFGQALQYIMMQLGITWEDLGSTAGDGVVNFCMHGSCYPVPPDHSADASDANN